MCWLKVLGKYESQGVGNCWKFRLVLVYRCEKGWEIWVCMGVKVFGKGLLCLLKGKQGWKMMEILVKINVLHLNEIFWMEINDLKVMEITFWQWKLMT